MNHSETLCYLRLGRKLVEYIPQKDRVRSRKSLVLLLDEYGLDEVALEEFKDVTII